MDVKNIKYTMDASRTDAELIAGMVETFMKAVVPPPPPVPINVSRYDASVFALSSAEWVKKVKECNSSFSVNSPTMTDEQIDKRLEAIMGRVTQTCLQRVQAMIDQFEVQIRDFDARAAATGVY